jgi:transmembrane sensor
MGDLDPRMQGARERIRLDWSDARSAAVAEALERRRHRRKVLRTTAGAMTAVALALGGLLATRSRFASLAQPSQRLADGTSIWTLDPSSQVVTRSTAPGRTVVEVVRGGARFVVTHNPRRTFRVEAGDVAIEDLGTTFTVERLGSATRVSVTEGRVRVLVGEARAELGAGESEIFARPPAPLAAPPAPVPVPVEEEPAPRAAIPHPSAPALAKVGRRVADRWKTLAEAGQFEQAFSEAPADSLTDAGDLLLFADVARMSRHPQPAADVLSRLLETRAADPRAPLAAFTLGRTLLEELGRPQEAAEAFARAEAAGGPLAADALAREVQAWAQAGDDERARASAQRYVARYPDGSRLRSVRRYGGLE